MNEPTKCRSCGESGLIGVLSLGLTPLANALLTAKQLGQPEETYPLDLVFCPHCTLVQITHTVPPETLFRDYFYLSSFADTVLLQARNLAERLIASQRLHAGSLVVEVGSNDGYLLQYYHRAGIPVLGIEPATRIARVAQDQRRISTLCEFFTEALAEKLRQQGRRADIVHANNVLAHIADLNGAVRGFKLLLKENGIGTFEVPYVKELIDGCQFDTIYHEHLCYFSLTALDGLFRRHGLIIHNVERINVHGGTLRIYISHDDDTVHHSSAVSDLLKEETEWGVDDPAFYRSFGAKVEGLRHELITILHDLKAKGRRIAVYGASAKGSTLLNYFGIGCETLDYVVDRSTLKQGHYTPGKHLAIRPPEYLLEDMPDYALLLTWNFADEILEQQAEYRRRGGRFIIPIPKVRVV